MGMFDLPRGEFELNLKPKKGKVCSHNGWTSVMFTDSLYRGDIAQTVEMWSDSYKVLGARFNGREVAIPKKYHWEHRIKDEVLGVYKTYAEGRAVMDERKKLRWKDKSVKVGGAYFVDDSQ